MRKIFLPAILCLLFSFKCVFINAQTSFTNSTAIIIPVEGPASPYSSNIVVAGLSGTITKVTLSINNITHPKTGDLDMLLVGPGGQTLV